MQSREITFCTRCVVSNQRPRITFDENGVCSACQHTERKSGEFPARYFEDFLEYTELTEDRFREVIDGFRKPHIWDKVNGEWKLKKQVE
jgi:hypothetical protein